MQICAIGRPGRNQLCREEESAKKERKVSDVGGDAQARLTERRRGLALGLAARAKGDKRDFESSEELIHLCGAWAMHR